MNLDAIKKLIKSEYSLFVIARVIVVLIKPLLLWICISNEYRFTANSIQECIKEAGFEPQLRTQHYVEREMPEMEEQLIDY